MPQIAVMCLISRDRSADEPGKTCFQTLPYIIPSSLNSLQPNQEKEEDSNVGTKHIRSPSATLHVREHHNFCVDLKQEDGVKESMRNSFLSLQSLQHGSPSFSTRRCEV